MHLQFFFFYFVSDYLFTLLLIIHIMLVCFSYLLSQVGGILWIQPLWHEIREVPTGGVQEDTDLVMLAGKEEHPYVGEEREDGGGKREEEEGT